MGSIGGWLNWRLHLGARPTDRTQSGECTYRSPMASSGLGHLDLAGSGLHDGGNAGAGTDLEADLPPDDTLPAGRHAQQAAVEVENCVPRTPESRRCRPRRFLRSIPHTELMRSSARRVVDRRVLHLIKMWLECSPRNPTTEDGSDAPRGARQRPWHSARVTIPPLPANLVHAPVCAGMGEARTAAKPRQSDRDLCRRSRDPV